MNPLLQKALFNGAIPLGVAVLGAAIAIGLAWRGHPKPRLATWIGPVTASIAVVVNFYGQDLISAGRWVWVVPAMLAPLLVWPVLLLPRLAQQMPMVILAGTLMAMIVSPFVWPTFYDEQELWIRLLPIVGAALLGGGLYNLATHGRTAAAVIGVALAVGALAPIVNFANFQSVAELLVPPAVIAGALGIVALSVRHQKYAEVTKGLAAGAVGIALVMPAAASVAWSNGYDLPPRIAWALVLAGGAPLAGLIGRFPIFKGRWTAPLVTVAATFIPAAAALYLAASWVDVAAYQAPF